MNANRQWRKRKSNMQNACSRRRLESEKEGERSEAKSERERERGKGKNDHERLQRNTNRSLPFRMLFFFSARECLPSVKFIGLAVPGGGRADADAIAAGADRTNAPIGIRHYVAANYRKTGTRRE